MSTMAKATSLFIQTFAIVVMRTLIVLTKNANAKMVSKAMDNTAAPKKVSHQFT